MLSFDSSVRMGLCYHKDTGGNVDGFDIHGCECTGGAHLPPPQNSIYPDSSEWYHDELDIKSPHYLTERGRDVVFEQSCCSNRLR